MADESAIARDPAQDQEELYQGSLRFIRECATGFGWEDVLKEIEEQYRYAPAYDVVYILARILHHTTLARPTEEYQERAGAVKRREAELVELRARIQQAVKDGDLSLALLVEGPRVDWRPVEVHGRLTDWHLDEFAGQIGVILGQARWLKDDLSVIPDAEGRPVHFDRYAEALSFGVELLRMTGVLPRGIEGHEISPDKQRDDLRSRFWRLKRENLLPPAPNDADPLAWAEAIDHKLEWKLREAIHDQRRYFVGLHHPDSPESARVDTWFFHGPNVIPRGPRWLPVYHLAHLLRLVPQDLLPFAFAAGELLEILRLKGIPVRVLEEFGALKALQPRRPINLHDLRQRLEESRTELPPDPDSPSDQPK